MRYGRRRYSSGQGALANFALTAFKATVVLFFLAIVMMGKNQDQSSGIKPDIEYAITMDWPGGLDDMDIWVRCPDGGIVMYAQPEHGQVYLERDDMGINNLIVRDSVEVMPPTNQEIVAIRGIPPGEYVVNVFSYTIRSQDVSRMDNSIAKPIPVTVTLIKMNPNTETLTSRTVYMTADRQEQHAFRFTILPDGEVTNIRTDLPIQIVRKIKK